MNSKYIAIFVISFSRFKPCSMHTYLYKFSPRIIQLFIWFVRVCNKVSNWTNNLGSLQQNVALSKLNGSCNEFIYQAVPSVIFTSLYFHVASYFFLNV